ncbi:MAG: hypothetical protein J7K96_12640 [Desulfobacteraceae bacterium]|nr:hypothetical protein [Desulfobacteraceae bacterium]
MKSIDVVSNTSPLIFLEKIDSLNLLKNCFRTVYISEGVKDEWGIKSIPSFISVHSLSEFGKSYVEGAIGRLHKGELEAIQSAVELNCKVILLDDLLARRAAEKKGLVPLGVLGVLKIACKLELLTQEAVRRKVFELINKHGLFISSNILKQYFDAF